jgi:hypothetical protein
MVCLGNICINTLHKGYNDDNDDDDDNNNNNNNNNNNILRTCYQTRDIFLHKVNVQGGSKMTGTDLCVNKPHSAAAVRP